MSPGGFGDSYPIPGSGGSPCCIPCEIITCIQGGMISPDGCGGAGFCSCLDESALVVMGDGSLKKAIEIEIGDKVLSGEGCPELIVDKLISVQPRLKIVTSVAECICSTTHHFMKPGNEQVPASDLEPGHSILAFDGETELEVLCVEALPEGQVVGFTCQPTHTYRAEGLLHHNKVWEVSQQAML